MLRKFMNRRRICAGLVGIVLLFAGTGIVRAKEAKKKPLFIGTGPYYYTKKLEQGLKPLIAYLSEELDREIRLIVTKSYEELADRVQSGSLDIGFFNAVLYVQLKQRYPQLKYLVTAQSRQGGKNTAYYFSWLIARKDSGISKVKNFRGKTFAFTNKHSASGYIYPQGYFHWRGIVPEKFFSRVIFAGTHARVTDMIAQGEVETGVSYDANLWVAEQKYGRIFRRIRKIGPILNPSLAAGAHVDTALCRCLVKALENIPSGVMNRDLVYTGFERISEEHFNSVKEMLKFTD
ncbi:MAG: phosphate/phosphite/phosphonate ABC transporter substrate-binding protein [Candidatus Electrothrix sp. EH2]|nr:phosphate/phosphite/phosphonate ABC transporter substrate-binding protein [Candidatus Electrothrix sp. EH2]